MGGDLGSWCEESVLWRGKKSSKEGKKEKEVMEIKEVKEKKREKECKREQARGEEDTRRNGRNYGKQGSNF
ncbi:MAG: hypothetical protein WBQ89_00880 [Candidatus Acidiferrum sp.]